MRIGSFIQRPRPIANVLTGIALLCYFSAPLHADETSDALNAIIQRTQSLSNITVEYTSRYETLGNPPGLPPQVANQHFHEETVNSFRLRGDRVRYEKSIDPNSDAARSPGLPAITKQITCFTPTRGEQAMWQSTMRGPTGVIYTDAKQLRNDPLNLIDVGLGLRDYRAAGWDITDLFKKADVHITSDHLIQIEVKDKNIERWTFDPALKDALTRFEIITGGETSVVVQCEDFHQVDGIFLPSKITLTNSHTFPPATTPMDLARQTLVITRVVVADPDNLKDETFMINWPKATPIFLGGASGQQQQQRPQPQKQMMSDRTQDKILTDDEITNYAATQEKYQQQLLEETRRRMAEVPAVAPAN